MTQLFYVESRLRRAQLYRIQGKSREALEWRVQASKLFRRNQWGQLHIDLEEARINLANDETRRPHFLAQGALEGWAYIKYAKGIADSLRLLAEATLRDGKTSQAIELYAAALCAYPVENNWANRKAFSQISKAYSSMGGASPYQKLLQEIERRAMERQGYFTFLNQVFTDPDENISQVVQRLEMVKGHPRG